MKIIAFVENQSNGATQAKHGLSLYIETSMHKILFDLGPDKTLFENSKALGIDLSTVDTVILSHGHMDHGGALEQFLEINQVAKIYVQKNAFEKHYTKVLFLKFDVSIDRKLMNHPQIVLVDGDYRIDDELMLFTVTKNDKCYSEANNALYSETGKDDFSHEQNLMILGDSNVLLMGCGHSGIVNIMETAAHYQPAACIGGYHLFNPVTKKTVPSQLLDDIAKELSNYSVRYYTCHCTGQAAFNYLSKRLPNMKYLSCGASIEV